MTIGTNAVPHPGSPEAVLKGCTCPILDNEHGSGYLGVPGMFMMTAGCPLHSPRKPETHLTVRANDVTLMGGGEQCQGGAIGRAAE